jgi:anti-anti-sigma factor
MVARAVTNIALDPGDVSLRRQDFTVLQVQLRSAPIVPLVGASYGRRVHSIRLSGEWDAVTTPAMRQSLAVGLRAIHAGSDLLLDVRDVSFCGSAGVRAILELVELAQRRHIVVRLVGVRPNVQRVFDILGFGYLVDGAPVAA